jgi:protein-S-isoprenylcysteine O-methyltransferase
MDELRLLELKEYRDRIIKKHLILIFLSFIISILISILYFIIFKYKNAFIFLFALFLFHSPLYIYILLSEQKPKKKYQYSMGVTLILTLCYSLSIILFTKTRFYHLFLYFITLCIYHYAEFFSELLFHFKDLQKDAFLIYENKRWVISTASSFVEYVVEMFFFQKYKDIKFFFILGLIMTVVGQYFRIAALFTGKSNFTHKVQMTKRKNHVLVKHGIYSICRHPSYSGFFIWSVGIEIMCINPLCTIAFAYILFNFFKYRIRGEEKYLIRFFGMEYIKYRREVGVLIPFIDIDKETEKENLIIYLEEHEDEKNNEEIVNFLNDKNEKNEKNEEKKKNE